METQTNITPEEVILSELQVSKRIISHNQRWSDYNTNVLEYEYNYSEHA